MQIDYADGVFVANIRYEEREAFKSAGWTWDADRRRWVTSDPVKAAPFQAFGTNYTLAALQAWHDSTKNALAQSYAEDMDIDIPVPPGLAYDAFQKPGIHYAAQRTTCLIADPPGLGKTIQAIGVSNYLPAIRKVLVVPPAHLVINWTREWRKWCVKGLSVDAVRSRTRRLAVRDAAGKTVKDEIGATIYESWREHHWPTTDVVIVNYDMLPEFSEELRAAKWDLAIFDESQYLVTATTIRTRNVMGGGKSKRKRKTAEGLKTVVLPAVAPIKAKRRLFLSGTPLMSRPIDLWTICQTADPQGLGKNWKTFVHTYCGAEMAFGRLDTSGATNLEALQTKLRTSFMIRRNKESVLKDLPPKRRQLIELPAEGLQKLVDREVSSMARVRDALLAFESLQKGIPDLEIEWTGLADMLEKRFGQYADLDYAARAKMLTPPEKVAFEELSIARHELALAKIPMIKEHIANIISGGEKVLCFTVHKDFAEALRQDYQGDCAFITGSVPMHKRQGEVDRFQNDPRCMLMIGNYVAAGTGYTMTAASNVVCAELDWVPATIIQAEDRAHRRGQPNAVLVQHLAVEGSIDARLVQVFLDKLEIEQRTLNADRLSTSHSNLGLDFHA